MNKKYKLLLLCYLTLFSVLSHACPPPTEEQIAETKFDYRSYMRNPNTAERSNYVETFLENDFVVKFPEGERKQDIISAIHLSIPNSVFLVSVEYDEDRATLVLRTISWSCNGVGDFIRAMTATELLAQVKLVEVKALENSDNGARAKIEVRLK